MEYRVCYCQKCGKESEFNLSSKVKCECGADNWVGTHFEGTIDGSKYSGVRIDKKVKEIFGEE